MADAPFYDRTEELALLNRKYKELQTEGRGSMLALYGRRRVGKTELVKKFMEHRSNKLYLYIDLAEKKVLLNSISAAIQEQLQENMVFADFDGFFQYVIEKSKQDNFLLVIDEFQRFMQVAPEVITSLQKNWDQELKNQKTMILLVGSSIGMIQKITNSKAGALYGRAIKIKISPFKYKDFLLMFAELPEEEKVVRYAVFGGTPYYLEKTKRYTDTLTAIKELILQKGGELSEEPKALLEYENVRIHAKNNSILQSISSGKEILKEIQDFTKMPVTAIPAYIEKLDSLLDLVEKNDPVLGKERLRRYRIKDNFFKFWYKFIFENQTALQFGNRELVADIITKQLNSYVGRIFEEVVRELFIAYNGKEIKGYSINFENIGGWWDRNGNEIDLLAYNDKEKKYLVGEVKWSSTPIDFDVVNNLLCTSEFLHMGGKYTFVMVSKAGFTEKCIQKMQENKIIYLDLGDIIQLFDNLNETVVKEDIKEGLYGKD